MLLMLQQWTEHGQKKVSVIIEKYQKKCPKLECSSALNSGHSKDISKSELLELVFA